MMPHDRDDPLTREILRACFEVMREIGHGFQETLYQRALALELANAGLQVEREAKFPVFYKKDPIGTFIADFVVEESVIVELKAVDGPLLPAHAGQCLNYLRASKLGVGLLVNFGRPKIEWRRLER